MSENRNSIGRRTFLARCLALIVPVATLSVAARTAQAKKQTVTGKSGYAFKTPKPTAQKTRWAVHTAHAFGKR